MLGCACAKKSCYKNWKKSKLLIAKFNFIYESKQTKLYRMTKNYSIKCSLETNVPELFHIVHGLLSWQPLRAGCVECIRAAFPLYCQSSVWIQCFGNMYDTRIGHDTSSWRRQNAAGCVFVWNARVPICVQKNKSSNQLRTYWNLHFWYFYFQMLGSGGHKLSITVQYGPVWRACFNLNGFIQNIVFFLNQSARIRFRFRGKGSLKMNV